MEWAESSEEIVLQQLNRLQNNNRVMLGNIRTGEVKTIHTERDDAWIEINDDLHWLEDGKKFSWLSDRDGWNHVYIYDRDGGNNRLLTPGDFDVVQIERIDDREEWLYYTACPDNPTQRYLYRIRLDGKKKADYLEQSILGKAFKGELVPQDPNDEPARVLLKRIKTERAKTKKPKRGKK